MAFAIHTIYKNQKLSRLLVWKFLHARSYLFLTGYVHYFVLWELQCFQKVLCLFLYLKAKKKMFFAAKWSSGNLLYLMISCVPSNVSDVLSYPSLMAQGVTWYALLGNYTSMVWIRWHLNHSWIYMLLYPPQRRDSPCSSVRPSVRGSVSGW